MSGPPTARETLASAFLILEREAPRAFQWMSAELRGLRIRCTVGHERFVVIGGGRPTIRNGRGQPFEADVEADRAAILALIHGETDFLTAIRSRRVRLVADISLMVRLSRAQRAFAEGAVRTPSMRELLRVFRD
jgi:hypothetical protein